MRVRALVQAGGAGERMERTFGPVPKPLVRVRGVALIERSLFSLWRAGILEVSVSVPAAKPEIARFVRSRAIPLAKVLGSEVSIIEETVPLGTLGAAAELRDAADAVLVVNADNLTGLDLGLLLDDHRASGAAVTLATHLEVDRLAYGEVRVAGGRVTEYVEKPRREALICSAIAVLGADALRALPRGRATGLPSFVNSAIESGLVVRAYRHSAPWIDVNDAHAVHRAETLIAQDPDLFELWARRVDGEVVGAVLEGPDGVLLERRPAGSRSYPGLWDTPGGKIEPGESPGEAMTRELAEELGLSIACREPLAVFDDVDPASDLVLRHHVYAVRPEAPAVSPRIGQRLEWFAHPEQVGDLSPVVLRSLAVCRGARFAHAGRLVDGGGGVL